MGYQHERDTFIQQATMEGLDLNTIHKLLRYATTLQRLAEAQCNGDYPYDADRDSYLHGTPEDKNGHKWHEKVSTTCPNCEASGVRKSAMVRSSDKDQFTSASGSPLRKEQDVKVCPDCRTQELVRAALGAGENACFDTRRAVPCKHENDCEACKAECDPKYWGILRITPIFQGDPRGAVLVLSTPSHPWTDSGGRGLYVPARPTL